MENYVKLNNEGIVIEMLQTSKEVSKEYMKVEYNTFENIQLGYKWNGKEFEEVSTEEVKVPETTEVTNTDLLEVLLAIGEKVGA